MKRTLLALALVAAGCDSKLSQEELMDPNACKGCHPKHFEQWSSSMHAYAAEDPVFIAMNARGQRETNGELGDACVQCHAPLAVRMGLTVDGLNLSEIDPKFKGVTCYFCHQIDAVEGDNNAAVHLAEDGVMRGGIPDPLDNSGHDSEYSPLHDRNDIRSSAMCGSCHDVVTPAGLHLERTYAEWQQTLFSRDTLTEKLTCSGCHMRGRTELAADFEGVQPRRVHDHRFPGVDIALTEFPGIEEQTALIQEELDNTVLAQMCVVTTTSGADVEIILENVAAGHEFPSGAAHDRRVWVEVIAYRVRDVVYESGVVPDGIALTSINDPDLWRLGDEIFDEDGNPVHMFWEARRFESQVLPGQRARDASDPAWIQTHVNRRFKIPGRTDRVTMKVKVRPMGLDVIDDLIASGDLRPEIRDRVPTFTLSTTELEWTTQSFFPCVPQT